MKGTTGEKTIPEKRSGRSDIISVAIVGGAGLTGRELLGIIGAHPYLQVAHITSDRHIAQSVAGVFPELEAFYPDVPEKRNNGGLHFSSHSDAIPEGMPVFLAVPNETALELIPSLIQKDGDREDGDASRAIVDLSGSYRLHDQAAFEKYYNLKHTSFELMNDVVYGMPEIFRQSIRGSRFVSNPGCYATAGILPIFFLGELREKISCIVIDAKSGVSGAGGRVLDGGFSFRSVNEDFRAYKILKHQHEPEIREYMCHSMPSVDSRPDLIFTPHLLPIDRGILATIVLQWKTPVDAARIWSILKKNISGEKFVRLLPEPEDVRLSRVRHTNYIDISCRTEGSYTVITAAIDNLVKGAAGQAIQNMNLMLGLDESSGLHASANF